MQDYTQIFFNLFNSKHFNIRVDNKFALLINSIALNVNNVFDHWINYLCCWSIVLHDHDHDLIHLWIYFRSYIAVCAKAGIPVNHVKMVLNKVFARNCYSNRYIYNLYTEYSLGVRHDTKRCPKVEDKLVPQ